MVAENPSPDNDTMLTLIETNEQLALAMTKHQRAILQARKVLGIGYEGNGSSSNVSPNGNDMSAVAPPPGPPPKASKTGRQMGGSGPSQSPQLNPGVSPESEKADDPFRDPVANPNPNYLFSQNARQPAAEQQEQRLAGEPYHPGFNPTQSYMGRQDSAVGGVAMHAAIPGTSEVERGVPEHPAELEEDTYGVSPARQAPIYRY